MYTNLPVGGSNVVKDTLVSRRRRSAAKKSTEIDCLEQFAVVEVTFIWLFCVCFHEYFQMTVYLIRFFDLDDVDEAPAQIWQHIKTHRQR